jgi:hypothetical protein
LHVHAPLVQTSPFAQAFPHAPQLEGSACRSTQAFPHKVLSQTGTHAEPWHCPLAQALPHAPQLFGSLTVLTQLPLHSESVPPQRHADALQLWPAPHA